MGIENICDNENALLASTLAIKSEMSEPGTSSSVIRGLGETPTRVSVIIDNPAYRPSGPSSNADVQSRHNSISETNLIPKEQKSRSWNDLHDPTNQQADQNGNDSDGSGLKFFVGSVTGFVADVSCFIQNLLSLMIHPNSMVIIFPNVIYQVFITNHNCFCKKIFQLLRS